MQNGLKLLMDTCLMLQLLQIEILDLSSVVVIIKH